MRFPENAAPRVEFAADTVGWPHEQLFPHCTGRYATRGAPLVQKGPRQPARFVSTILTAHANLPHVNAIIVSVGTELVTGQCLDTNSAWLAGRLLDRGVTTVEHITVGDDVPRLAEAILRAAAAADVVVLTGGLGPTLDDITRDALAAALGAPLNEDAEALRQIEAFFKRVGRSMAESNRRQALLPRGCRMIPNAKGTAPGIYAEIGRDEGTMGPRDEEKSGHPPGPAVAGPSPLVKGRGIDGSSWTARVWALPGVPSEMKAMFDAAVAPALAPNAAAWNKLLGEELAERAVAKGRTVVIRRLKCFGITEARLGEMIADLMARGRNPNVGTTASDAVLTVRIMAEGEGPAAAARLAQDDVTQVRARLGTAVYGEEDDTLQSEVSRLLLARGKTVATAESCTGGSLAERLTELPRSSSFFLRGWVTYSNESKVAELGVAAEVVQQFGAVSEEVARAMAVGARRVASSDFALSITGIAGPTGGSPDKPVGLVFVGLADAAGAEAKRFTFGEHLSRREIRDRAAKTALNMLRLRLLE